MTACLLLAVAACGQGRDTSTAAAFTFRLDPASATVHQESTVAVQVAVLRTASFGGPVDFELLGDTPGVTAEPLTVTGDSGTLRLAVTEDATTGTTFLTVAGRGGGGERRETLTVQVLGVVAEVVDVTLRGADGSAPASGEVRQGYGGLEVVISGYNLDRVSSVTFGGLSVDVLAQTPELLTLQTEVPHGATPGPKDLVLEADGGETSTAAAALVVTPLTVSPAGDDDAGAGTTSSPFRTLSHALAVAADGDTVRLNAGTYGTGETWPRADGGAPNVPTGVRVAGEGPSLTILEGSVAEVALSLAGSGTISGLQVRGFKVAVRVSAEQVALEDLVLSANGSGLEVLAGEASVKNSSLSENSEAGVRALGAAKLQLTDSRLEDNGTYGASLAGSATFEGAALTVAGNAQEGVTASGAARLVLSDTRVDSNGGHGVRVGGSAAAELQGGEYSRNAGSGIWFGGSALKMRQANVEDNAIYPSFRTPFGITDY